MNVPVNVILSAVERALSTPFGVVISAAVNVPIFSFSERTIVTVAVSPIFRTVSEKVILETVGARVSTMILIHEAVLLFPTASVNVDPATSIVAFVSLLGVGVKRAVYEVPAPANAESVPPATVTSPEPKFTEDSERVKVRFAVVPEVVIVLLLPIVIVGSIVSTVIPGDGAAKPVIVLFA